jgi:hypothetical protein
MAANLSLLKPFTIAAGGLGCVSINSTVIFTHLKHLEISIVQVANSVKYILRISVLPHFCCTFPNLTFALNYLDATQHVRYIFVIIRCISVSLPPSGSRPNLTF